MPQAAGEGEGCSVNADLQGGMHQDGFVLGTARSDLELPDGGVPGPPSRPPWPRREIVCWIATALVAALTALSLLAWYLAAAEERGFYHQPWHKPTSLLWHVSLLTEAWWYAPMLYFFGGVAVTLWAVTPLTRRPRAAPAGDARMTGVASGRAAVVDVFAGFLESHLRPIAVRGHTLLNDLPGMIEVGTAQDELMAFARAATQDFEDLQRLTRLYRPEYSELTDIVAATMEFNYFEVVTAARDVANVLARDAWSGHGGPKKPQPSYEGRRQAFDAAVRRLAEWVDSRARMLAAQRAAPGRPGPDDDQPRTGSFGLRHGRRPLGDVADVEHPAQRVRAG